MHVEGPQRSNTQEVLSKFRILYVFIEKKLPNSYISICSMLDTQSFVLTRQFWSLDTETKQFNRCELDNGSCLAYAWVISSSLLPRPHHKVRQKDVRICNRWCFCTGRNFMKNTGLIRQPKMQMKGGNLRRCWSFCHRVSWVWLNFQFLINETQRICSQNRPNWSTKLHFHVLLRFDSEAS